MKTFSEFSELIEEKIRKVPNFRGAGGSPPPPMPKGASSSPPPPMPKGASGSGLRMVTTNPMSNTFAQNFLNRAAATRTMMTRTLPGAVLAGSLAGIDLLRQKREQEKSNAETQRVSRIASNYGPGGPQRLTQGPKKGGPMPAIKADDYVGGRRSFLSRQMPDAGKPGALGIPGDPTSPRIGDYVGGKRPKK